MNHTNKLLICALIITALAPMAAGAQQMKTHSSDKHGYSLEYPAEWYFRDGSGELEISTAKNAYEADRPGAGVSVMVKPVKDKDEGRPEKALRRILGEADTEFNLGRVGTRRIGGKEWYAVAFTSEDNGLEGDIFVLIRGIRVYFFGVFFRQAEARKMFQSQIDRLVDSFRFADRKLTSYASKAKGLSFRHPDIAEIKDERESVTVVIEGDNPAFDDTGAAMTIGLIDASSEEMENLDEKGFIDMLKNMGDETGQLVVVSENEPVTVMKTTWYKSVLQIEGKHVTFVLHRYGGHFFAAALLVSPASAAADYGKAFDVFLSSLSFDPQKWVASLNSKE